jgi:hypothetical protein
MPPTEGVLDLVVEPVRGARGPLNVSVEAVLHDVVEIVGEPCKLGLQALHVLRLDGGEAFVVHELVFLLRETALGRWHLTWLGNRLGGVDLDAGRLNELLEQGSESTVFSTKLFGVDPMRVELLHVRQANLESAFAFTQPIFSSSINFGFPTAVTPPRETVLPVGELPGEFHLLLQQWREVFGHHFQSQ